MTDANQQTGMPSSQDDGPSFWRRALGVTLRVLLVVLIGVGLGVGAYWGVPAVYRDFIAPVQQNTQQLEQSRAELADLRAAQRVASATQLAQLADIQGEIAQQGEDLSALQADVGSLQASQPTLAAGVRSLDRLDSDLADLQAAATRTAGQIEALGVAASTPNSTIQAVDQRLEILRLMQLVSQARLSLAEGNLGQAGTDVESAKAALSDLITRTGEDHQAALQDVGTRLDLAQQEAKANPSVAAGDLDIAWQLLVELSRAP